MTMYYEYTTFSNLNKKNCAFEYSEFVECTFANCQLENLNLKNCKFTDCTYLNSIIINPIFSNCTMTGSSFIDCHLLGINWSQLSADFIAPINQLQGCQIKYNHFINNNYPRFQFSDNDIIESIFVDCNLSHSNFYRCQLRNTEFLRCNLHKASFQNAYGYNIDISSCQLKEAIFSFPEVTNLLNGLGIIIK